MTQSASKSPVALLRDIDRRSKQHAMGLPRQEEVKKTWSGIAFRLGEALLVAPLMEVREILTYPGLSQVPRAKSWLKGIANVRGNLLPIITLQSFLGRPAPIIGRRSRVLVVQHAGLFAGLVVDEVLGMKHFLEEEYNSAPPADINLAREYLRGSYKHGEEQWPIFSTHKLVQSPSFLQANA
ncbi:MAG: chemotaxis protein CheW [Gammaproteobacteria bacterium]|nr:chemotaxis protein CheW [Gammaproteobacteria bacterium]